MNTFVRPTEKLPVVFTSKARCRDCYRCVRVCPAHAIQMKDGQAHVMPIVALPVVLALQCAPRKPKNIAWIMGR